MVLTDRKGNTDALVQVAGTAITCEKRGRVTPTVRNLQETLGTSSLRSKRVYRAKMQRSRRGRGGVNLYSVCALRQRFSPAFPRLN